MFFRWKRLKIKTNKKQTEGWVRGRIGGPGEEELKKEEKNRKKRKRGNGKI